MKNRYIQTRNNLTVVIDGVSKIISAEHPNFKTVLRLGTRGRWKDAAGYLDLKEVVKRAGKEAKTVVGQDTHAQEKFGEKALRELEAGRDPEHLKAFLKRCLVNPDQKSIQELADFLQHIQAPFTADGYFFAYKAVRDDFKDQHSGTFDNSPGRTVSIPRNKVDSNRRNECSYGLHVGALEYVQGNYMKSRRSTGGGQSGSRYMLVLVDPADVVSVPTDYSGQKMRVCRYVAVRELK